MNYRPLVWTFLLAACAGTPSRNSPPRTELAAAAPATEPAPPKPQCAAGSPEAALGTNRERSSAELVSKLGTGVDAYHLQSGAWLAGAPVLVNEEFDFAVAMGMGSIGAGIAAKQRADHNAARVNELSAVKFPEELVQELDALRSCGIHRWVLSWKTAQPVLKVVTDVYDAQGHLLSSQQADAPFDALTSPETWRLPIAAGSAAPAP